MSSEHVDSESELFTRVYYIIVYLIDNVIVHCHCTLSCLVNGLNGWLRSGEKLALTY